MATVRASLRVWSITFIIGNLRYRVDACQEASNKPSKGGGDVGCPVYGALVRIGHGVGVALEAAQVHLGDGDAVAGDAEASASLLTRFDGRLQRTAGAERRRPLVGVDEIVQLEQVDARTYMRSSEWANWSRAFS
jgi:hypothetical protein